jgi:hypothetical protein
MHGNGAKENTLFWLRFNQHAHPKVPRDEYSGFVSNNFSKGVVKWRTLLGVLFMRCTAATKASSQNFKVIEAWTWRERPPSTICRCFQSADPFCWWAWGHETWCVMPTDRKKGFNFSYSPPVGLHGKNLPRKESFYQVLEIMKFLKDFRFKLQQINPCKLTKVVNEANIVFLALNRIRSRPPYIREHKF